MPTTESAGQRVTRLDGELAGARARRRGRRPPAGQLPAPAASRSSRHGRGQDRRPPARVAARRSGRSVRPARSLGASCHGRVAMRGVATATARRVDRAAAIPPRSARAVAGSSACRAATPAGGRSQTTTRVTSADDQQDRQPHDQRTRSRPWRDPGARRPSWPRPRRRRPPDPSPCWATSTATTGTLNSTVSAA